MNIKMCELGNLMTESLMGDKFYFEELSELVKERIENNMLNNNAENWDWVQRTTERWYDSKYCFTIKDWLDISETTGLGL